MGCCSSVDDRTKGVNKELMKDKENDDMTFKLLLLGAGGSGKSTCFKQLKYIHGAGIEQSIRKQIATRIHEQIIDSMKKLIGECEDYYRADDEKDKDEYKLYDYDNPENDNDETKDIREKANYVLQLSHDKTEALDSKTADVLKQLWGNNAIQKMLSRKNEISIPDSTEYFYMELDRVSKSGYVPNDRDVLLVRYRTTGMVEQSFEVKNRVFKICDVGGQRSERRKWINFFSGVTAVIFVVSLSCYDETIFEADVNGMDESLDVFKEQVNSKTFVDTPFILFLNKSDLFYEKIEKVAITEAPCFSGYQGDPHDKDETLIYIKKIFNQANQNDTRSVFMHVTCATDKDNIEKVFNDVQTMIIEWSLAKAGLTV